MAVVEIFSGPHCAYCEQAKSLMQRNRIAFAEYRIDESEHLQEYQRRLPRSRSVPQIFVDGEHIGNDQDLAEWVNSGRLK